MIDLKGKKALITGASRGIGKAAALLLAQAGCDVVVNYNHNEDQASQVASDAEKFQVRARALQADVSKKKDVERMIEQAVTEFGGIDILVNNAGIWCFMPSLRCCLT